MPRSPQVPAGRGSIGRPAGHPKGPLEPSGSVDLGELIRYLTVNLVDQPEQVVVSLVEERDASVYEIEVGDEDLGKIIGKGGKTARAIRTVVTAVAPRSRKRTLVEILE